MQNKSLVLDLVSWVNREPRTYSAVMDAWRTSCPRLTIWEDAVDFGFVERRHDARVGAIVVATSGGKAFLISEGRS